MANAIALLNITRMGHKSLIPKSHFPIFGFRAFLSFVTTTYVSSDTPDWLLVLHHLRIIVNV
jgi:hypothetical protein